MHAQTENYIPERAIYVACLAAYNNGRLHGRWIDATQDVDDIHAEIREMLAASPAKGAEEFAIHDYSGFAGINLGEYESIETVCAIGQALDEIDDDEAFAAWYENESRDFSDADSMVEAFRDAYQGTFSTLEDWASDYVEQTGMLEGVSETIARYFDFEAYARDCRLGGDIWTADVPGGVAVFSNI